VTVRQPDINHDMVLAISFGVAGRRWGVAGMARCRRWHRGTYDFPDRTQRRYAHRNDTWGRIVPVDVLAAEVAVKREALRQRVLFRVPS
jgi:hypothetical protein